MNMNSRPFRIFKFKKSLIIIAVIALAVGAIVLITKNLSAPAIGSVVQTPSSKPEVVNLSAQPGKYNGKYISFPYPAHYQLTPAVLSGSYLEVANYHFIGAVSRQMNVGVYKGDLYTDGSVDYRQKHPDLYRKNTSSLGIEFSKLDGSEDTFFLSHNDLLTSISEIGPTAKTDNDALFVASSLHWK